MMKLIVTDGFREARRSISSLGDAADISEADLLAFLDQVPELVAQYPASYLVEYRGENSTWFNYESLIWTLGESCRRLLKGERKLRRSAAIWERVEALCLNRRYGKGRESFTMLLGQYGGLERVPVLLRLLDDPDVCGQALYALRLLGAPEAIEQARDLLHAPKGWIRQEAKKYLKKIGAAEP